MASSIADLIGFAGAISLAVPFLRGQPPRNTLTLADHIAVPDTEDAAALNLAKAEIVKNVAQMIRSEYAFAWGGALAIASAFILKFITSIF